MTTSIGDVAAGPSFAGSAAVARRDISPPIGIRNRNWGLATTDVSEGVHRPFTLTALAFGGSDGQRPLILMCIDGSWWGSNQDEWQLRSAVLEALDIQTDQLLISLSHTHAGAVLCAAESELDGGNLIPAYLDKLREEAISAGTEALANLAPANVQWTTGSCTVASNREVQVDGRMLVGFNPDKAADDTVVIGRISNASGDTVGTLVNYACHPTTLAWQNQKVSPDYIGAMREVVETNTGAPCAFVQGASGDLAPREQYVGDLGVADRHGASLGHSVLAALHALPPSGTALALTAMRESGAPLAVWEPQPYIGNGALGTLQETVELEPQKKPSIEDLRQRWAHIDPQSLEERLRRAQHSLDESTDDGTFDLSVWAWQIGDAAFVAYPGEAFSILQQNLRERHHDRPIVVMNLTNGPACHYLPPEVVYRNKGYASWASKVAAGSLERLEQHASELIDRLTKGTV